MRRRALLSLMSALQTEPSIPNNEIWYTTSDGNIVTPYTTGVFGANIVSNNYINGQGVISFDGPVTSIGNRAFAGCDSLTSITIPESVTSIGGYAFWKCSSLASITIPNGVTLNGGQIFRNCTSLTSITIPDSVTTISDWVFENCTSLTSITIPDSVTTIGKYAFNNCTSLVSVYCKAATPPTLGGTYVFDNNASDRKIYVPYQSLDAYKTATYWSEYADDIVGYDFENDTVVKTINYIRMSYEESGPDEYSVSFRSDFDVTSDIMFQMGNQKATMDIGTFIVGMNIVAGVPTLERLTYSPKEDDYYIYEVIMESASVLITFTVDGVEYQAEEGMTWGEWVDSEYNTKSDSIINYDPYIHAGGESFICSENEAEDGYLDTRVLVDDIIISNKTYYIKSNSPI